MEIPITPPYFVRGNELAPIIPTFSQHDLSSQLKLKNEQEIIGIQFFKGELTK